MVQTPADTRPPAQAYPPKQVALNWGPGGHRGLSRGASAEQTPSAHSGHLGIWKAEGYLRPRSWTEAGHVLRKPSQSLANLSL